MSRLTMQEALQRLTHTIRHWINETGVDNEGILESTNIDSLVSPGYYFLTANYEYEGLPAGHKEGILFVVVDDNDYVYQLFISYTSLIVYSRTKLDEEFSDWFANQSIEIFQEKGTSTSGVMSQNAVTLALQELEKTLKTYTDEQITTGGLEKIDGGEL